MEAAMPASNMSASNRPAPNRVIRHPADLGALSVFTLMQPSPRGTVTIESDALDETTRSAWERRLNRAYRACGCGEAALGTIVGLIVAGVWIAVRMADGDRFRLEEWLIILGSAIVGTALGKTVGLLRAKSRLEHLIKEIAAEWKAEPRRFADTGCG
jgi:hypothetical protein